MKLFLVFVLTFSCAVHADTTPLLTLTYYNNSACTIPSTSTSFTNHSNILADNICRWTNDTDNVAVQGKCNAGVAVIDEFDSTPCTTIPTHKIATQGECLLRSESRSIWYRIDGCGKQQSTGSAGPLNILLFNNLNCTAIDTDLIHQSAYDSLVGIPLPDTSVASATCHVYSTNPYYYRLYYINNTAVQFEYWGRWTCGTPPTPQGTLPLYTQFNITIPLNAASVSAGSSCVASNLIFTGTTYVPMAIRVDGLIATPSSSSSTAAVSSSTAAAGGASSSSTSTSSSSSGTVVSSSSAISLSSSANNQTSSSQHQYDSTLSFVMIMMLAGTQIVHPS